MRILKKNPILTIVNSYLVDSPQPSTISYLWNFGSLLGLCLVCQIISGILLAMHVRHFAFFVILNELRYLSVIKIKSFYLGIRGNLLLNLACRKKVYLFMKLLVSDKSDEVSKFTNFSNVWLKLYYLKSNLQQNQAGIHSLDSYGRCQICDGVGVHDSIKTAELMYCNNVTIKGMSRQPKGTCSYKECIMVFTKGSNTYVKGAFDKSVLLEYANSNRLGNTNIFGIGMQKRNVANIGLRYYSIDSGENHKNVLKRLNDLHNFSTNYPNKYIDRRLYSEFILSKVLYIIAYNKLRSNPGMMTPGINPTTLDGISDEKLDKLIEDLRTGTFKFTPAKRIYIDKPSGGIRPLSLGNPIDKLVQEVMRMVLEAIYEPLFSNNSHGFRRNKSCHTALRYIFSHFKGCTWWIEGDIEKCFNSIPHDKLINVLEEKIKDKRFIQLIKLALNAGYMFDRKLEYDIVGTPQGSIISPILANIYLDKLDKFIENIKLDFDSNIKCRSRYNRYKEYRSIESKLGKAKKRPNTDKKLLRKLSIKLRNTPTRFKSAYDNKLMYVRYADDWIVAINGSYKETVLIKDKIIKYCKEKLDLTVSTKKTKITNTYTDHVLFLGTNIKHSGRRDVIRKLGHKVRSPGILMLTAPMSRIAKKLANGGFHRYHKGLTKTIWLHLELSQIIHLANSVIRGYLNYYSFVYNRNRLVGYVYYIVKDAVLRTIAAKMRLRTRAQVIKKYNKNLYIYNYDSILDKNLPKNKRKPKLIIQFINVSKCYRMDLWNFKIKVSDIVQTCIPALYADSISLATVLAHKCMICKSDYRVEMHHIKQLKDISHKKGGLDYLMSKARRKQIPLCRSCHMQYHYGNLIIPK